MSQKKITYQQIQALRWLHTDIEDTRAALNTLTDLGPVSEQGVPGAIRPWRPPNHIEPVDVDALLWARLYERLPAERQRQFWQLSGPSLKKISFLLHFGSTEGIMQ